MSDDNVIPLYPQVPDDLGLELDGLLESFSQCSPEERAERVEGYRVRMLVKMIELKAPEVLIQKQVKLVTQAAMVRLGFESEAEELGNFLSFGK